MAGTEKKWTGGQKKKDQEKGQKSGTRLKNEKK